MIFEFIIIMWILSYLHAPVWVWIMATMYGIEEFYFRYQFNRFRTSIVYILEILTNCLKEIEERPNGKKVQDNNNDKEGYQRES